MFIRALTALLGTALLAAPAFAQGAEPMSVPVRIADLDLSTPGDRARLDRRVRQAAGQICGAAPRALEFRDGHRACRSEVIGGAEVYIARRIDRTAPILVARRAD